MITVTHGKVTPQHLADAALFAGIEPTSFVTEKEVPLCPKVPGEPGVLQQHWRMVLRADALICVGENEHLCKVAESHGLLVYQVPS